MIKEALLYKKEPERITACYLCCHRCRIAPSKYGFCGVRRNVDGTLYTQVYGEVIASHLDPIEKKPLYHFLPGSVSYSIATLGCNFHCGFCQNWEISQSNKRDSSEVTGYELKPEEVVREAKKSGCRSISYTYTEPTVYFEYALDTMKLAREAGIKNVFVTNGYMTKEALKMAGPYLDACNVDLKSYSDKFYKDVCSGSLGPVLDSIRTMKEMGVWVEVTTLVIPKKNDSKKEMGDIAAFIAGLDKDTPWHISRFHPDYDFEDYAPTPIKTIEMAAEAGRRAGLRYVYMGNVPGVSGDTVCPGCGNLLIKRSGFSADIHGLKGSACGKCGAVIRGVF